MLQKWNGYWFMTDIETNCIENKEKLNEDFVQEYYRPE